MPGHNPDVPFGFRAFRETLEGTSCHECHQAKSKRAQEKSFSLWEFHIKLMSIVALTVAQSMNGAGDWDLAAWGIIPLCVMILVTCCVKVFQWRRSKAGKSQTRNVSCISWAFCFGLAFGTHSMTHIFLYRSIFQEKNIGDLELLLNANTNEPLSRVI